MVLLKVGQMQSYLHFKINLPPVLKAGSSGKSILNSENK